MSTMTNLSLVITRRQNILSEVKHQVRDLAENAKTKTSQPPLFALHMHAVIDI